MAGTRQARSPGFLLKRFPAARRPLLAAGLLAPLAGAAVVAQGALAASLLARIVTASPPLARLEGGLAALAAVVVVRFALLFALEASAAQAGARAAAGLRGELAAALLEGGFAQRCEEEVGAFAALAGGGAEGLRSLVGGYLPQLLLAAVVPVAVLAYVTYLDPVAGGLLAVTVPISVLFLALVGRHAVAVSRARQAALARLSGYFLDVIGGLASGRALRRERVQGAALRAAGELYRRRTMEALRAAFLSALVLELAAMVGMALVAAVVGVQLDGGETTLKIGLTALLLGPELFGAIRTLGQRYHQGSDGSAALERAATLLGPAAGPPRREAEWARAPEGVCLALEDATFAYPGRPPALREARLSIGEGEVVAVCGPSGAGKSTLALLVAGLLTPKRGVVARGEALLRAARAGRPPVALLPQRPTVFAGSLLENVGLYRPRLSPAAALRLLEELELGGLARRIGLEGRVGEGGLRLSAGEAQRLALARVLASEAPLLVLDEPFAHLDEELARLIAGRLLEAVGGRSLLVVAHGGDEPALATLLARAAGRYELSEGRLVAASQPRSAVGGRR